MRLTRRHFLAGTVAGAAFPSLARAQVAPTMLRALAADIQLLPDGYGKTTIWGYDGQSPGPQIRLRRGDRVQRALINELPQSTSIHWHGIRIDNAMDGVAGLTQKPVIQGASFDYDFVAPDAGTYWYHAHNRSVEQVARGLYGPLIVEEPDAIDIDREELLIMDDWLVDPDTGQIEPDFTSMHDRSHGGRIGNYITVNGQYELSFGVKRNERLRLRLINASNAKIFQLALDGMAGWVVALDGMPLAEPEPFAEFVLLGPGQRADLVLDVTAGVGETAHLVRLERQQGFSQVSFAVTADAATTRRPAPSPLPPNRVPGIDLAQARRVPLLMEGGAMGGLTGATMNGELLTMGQLVDAGQVWAFNGTVGRMGDDPLAEVSMGETVRLAITNDTAFPHAMHLHGMHFQEVAGDGTLGPLRDTILMLSGETREIAFVADNPGDWLFHCHMLSHAASGMTTWMRVA